jgi:hypothetical protein
MDDVIICVHYCPVPAQISPVQDELFTGRAPFNRDRPVQLQSAIRIFYVTRRWETSFHWWHYLHRAPAYLMAEKSYGHPVLVQPRP